MTEQQVSSCGCGSYNDCDNGCGCGNNYSSCNNAAATPAAVLAAAAGAGSGGLLSSLSSCLSSLVLAVAAAGANPFVTLYVCFHGKNACCQQKFRIAGQT